MQKRTGKSIVSLFLAVLMALSPMGAMAQGSSMEEITPREVSGAELESVLSELSEEERAAFEAQLSTEDSTGGIDIPRIELPAEFSPGEKVEIEKEEREPVKTVSRLDVSDPFVFMVDEYVQKYVDQESEEVEAPLRSRRLNPKTMLLLEMDELSSGEHPYPEYEIVEEPALVGRFIVRYAEGGKASVEAALSKEMKSSESIAYEVAIPSELAEKVAKLEAEVEALGIDMAEQPEDAKDSEETDSIDADVIDQDADGTSDAEDGTDVIEPVAEDVPSLLDEANGNSRIFADQKTIEEESGSLELDSEAKALLAEARAARAELTQIEDAKKAMEAMPDIEVITLKKAVLPSEFAEELRSKGLEGDIVYIQPDYALQLDSIDEEEAEENSEEEIQDPVIEESSSEEESSVSDEASSSEEGSSSEEASSSELPGSSSEASSSSLEPTTSSSEVPSSSSTPEVVKPDEKEKVPVVEEEKVTEPKSVIVAMIDTGIDITHRELRDYIYINAGETADNRTDDDNNGYTDDVKGWNFPAGSGKIDADYHGTHIAGIITKVAEETNTDIKIMPLQVFKDGKAYTSDIIAAIEYAVANGATVINMSFGSKEDNPALFEVIAASDVLFVAAVGNHRADMATDPKYPAAYRLDNLISVASTNADDGFSYYSNYGEDRIDITARGRDVVSTLPNNEEGPMTGTSMSAGYVSAVAAAAATKADLTATQLKERIVETADRLDNLQNKVIDGRRVNLENALSDTRSDDILMVNCEDDFDVHGYQPTPEESWELYLSGRIVRVVTVDTHTAALKEDGTVWMWGYNGWGSLGDGTTITYYDYPVQVVGLNNCIAITAGYGYTIALKKDGTVWAWGYNSDGQLGDGTATHRKAPVQVIGLDNVNAVSGGYHHVAALKADGTVWLWGYNGKGQLGDGTTTHRKSPVQAIGLNDVTFVVAGNPNSFAVKSNGTVWAWGLNNIGELDDGTKFNSSVPVQVNVLNDVSTVALGSSYVVVLKKDGTVWAWGTNGSGQLGDGTRTSRTVPVQVIGLSDVSAIDTGNSHTIALKSDSTVWSWGSSQYGQLGNGRTNGGSTPMQVIGLNNVSTVAACANHTVVLKSDGTVWGWGLNDHVQLGDGSMTLRNAPSQINGLDNVNTTVVGAVNTMVIKTDGTVWGWGENTYGQLGDGTTIDRSTPVMAKGLNGIKIVAMSSRHSVALKADGTVWTWGWNAYGQLGDGTTTTHDLPVQVNGLNNVSTVAANGSHTVALKTDGTVWAWGKNDSGQLGDGTTTNCNIPVQVNGLSNVYDIAVGSQHTVALKTDGTVWAWGNNALGQLGAGPATIQTTPVQVEGLSDVSCIAAGYVHTVAVKSDGTVWSWGGNSFGQLGDDTRTNRIAPVLVKGLSGVNAIAATWGHTVALKSDGTVWIWGYNGQGQLGDGTFTDRFTPVQVNGLSNINAITTDYRHVFAVDTNNTIWAWGLNYKNTIGLKCVEQYAKPIQCFAEFLPAYEADDFPDTQEHAPAKQLRPGALLSVGGYIDVSEDVDWFAAKAMGSGTFDINISTSNEDVKVDVYDKNMRPISSDSLSEVKLAAEDICYFKASYTGAEYTNRMPYEVNITGKRLSTNVSHGYYHTLAIKEDGTVWAWGRNHCGQLGNGTKTDRVLQAPVANLKDIVKVSAGSIHSLALDKNGRVWAWGYNYEGELGLGTQTDSTTPVCIPGLTDIVDISAGYNFSLAVKADGTVWAWGRNNDGQLGIGSSASMSLTPVKIPGISDVIDVECGWYYALALKSDGSVWGWGKNSSGQLGDGTKISRTSPTKVNNLKDIIYISSGAANNFAMSSDGIVWIWGSNSYGRLGDGTTNSYISPVVLSHFQDAQDIKAYGFHGLVIKADGTIWAVGYNSNGQLGDGTTVNSTIPVANGLGEAYVLSEGKYYTSSAMREDGSIWAWGRNDYGHVGNGGKTNVTNPVQVWQRDLREEDDGELKMVTDIAAGRFHTAILKSDGTVWTWGRNDDSQLGNGTTTDSMVPVKVLGLDHVVAIASGYYHTLAIKDDGTVWGWGYNYYSQLGDGSRDIYHAVPVKMLYIDDAVAIAAGRFHSLVLRSDGTVWQCGYTGYEATTNISSDPKYNLREPMPWDNMSNIKAIAAGGYHSLALDEDGNVWGWGYNQYKQIDKGEVVPNGGYRYVSRPFKLPSIKNAINISAGYGHSAILTSDGSVNLRGAYRSSDERADMHFYFNKTEDQFLPAFENAISIMSGDIFDLIVSESAVWSYGGNVYGQLGREVVDVESLIDRPHPISRSGGTLKIASGQNHTLMLRYDGSVWAWGHNNYGQIGDRTTINRHAPVQIIESPAAIQADDYANDPEDADIRMFSGEAPWYVRGDLEHATDRDAHGIMVSDSGRYKISLEGPGDTTFYFMNDQYKVLATSSGQEVDLAAGNLYYVTIYHRDKALFDPHAYELYFELADDYTNTSSNAPAEIISTGELFHKEGWIQYKSDEDWFAVKVIEAGDYKIQLASENEHIKMSVYDTSLVEMMPTDNALYTFESDTVYYIKLSYDAEFAFEICEYTLEVKPKGHIDSITKNIQAVAGNTYHLPLSGVALNSIGDAEFKMNYDTTKLRLVDFAGQTPAANTEVGAVADTLLTIISHTDGVVVFQFAQPIEEGREWTGFVTAIKFEGIASGEATVVIEYEGDGAIGNTGGSGGDGEDPDGSDIPDTPDTSEDDYPDNYSQAVVETITASQTSKSCRIDYQGDQDWFAIRFNRQVNFLPHVQVNSDKVHVELYDENLQPVSFSPTSFTPLDANRTYYIKISDNTTGEFQAFDYYLTMIII